MNIEQRGVREIQFYTIVPMQFPPLFHPGRKNAWKAKILLLFLTTVIQESKRVFVRQIL